MSIYKSLKHTLQDAYRFSVWFDVKLEGLATQLWKFEARLNTGATMVYRSFRSKFRALVLKVFENHLSCEQFSQFKSDFSRITKMLQIEEDVAPFTEHKRHSWTLDGIPDIGEVDTDAFAACGGTTQVTVLRTSVPGSSIPAPSIAALLPAGSGPADGSSGRAPHNILSARRHLSARVPRRCLFEAAMP